MTVPTPAPPLADTLDRLADELALLPHLPETGGDGYLNRIIPLMRAAASELRRLEAVETVPPDPARTASLRISPGRLSMHATHLDTVTTGQPSRAIYSTATVANAAYLLNKAADALAASEARLAEVEREREALRRMARQLIDVTGADGFRWYVDGPAELGDVVARAGTIIGYTPWERPAARSAGEAGDDD